MGHPATRGTLAGARVAATRERILVAAERLYAEQGVLAVSNRQVSEAAGQGNTAAVGYHFGTKADLVRAILRKHSLRMEQRRTELVAAIGDSADVRAWVGALVRPFTDHLAGLGTPTWFARFAAQVTTDPALRQIVVEESLTAPALRRVVEGLDRCLPELPPDVRDDRETMARHVLLHGCAERERALADDTPTPRTDWDRAATGLIDVISAIWLAPVTPPIGDRS